MYPGGRTELKGGSGPGGSARSAIRGSGGVRNGTYGLGAWVQSLGSRI